jgi:MFS family permease
LPAQGVDERQEVPAPQGRTAVKPLHLHIVLSTFNHLAFTGSRLVVMLYAAHLQASPAVIGVLAALFGLVSAFTAVSFGRWIDRIGPRKPMMIASVMVVTGGLIAGLWHDVLALFVISPMIGTFNSMFQIATQQTIGRYGRPEDRVANFALQSLGVSMATFSGPLIAGLAIDHLGYPSAFLLLALCGLVPLPVIGMGWLHFPARLPRTRPAGAAASGGVAALLRDEGLRRIFIVAALNNGVWSVVSFLIPLYGAQIGLSATRIGAIMACFATATVGIRVALQFLIRRFRPWQLVIVSQTLVAVAFLGIPLTARYAMLLPLSFVMGLGLGLSGPMSTTLLYEASPPERVGEVVGLRVTLANLAQTVVPLLSGAVGAAVGVLPVFWAVAALLAADSYANREQWRRRRR